MQISSSAELVWGNSLNLTIWINLEVLEIKSKIYSEIFKDSRSKNLKHFVKNLGIFFSPFFPHRPGDANPLLSTLLGYNRGLFSCRDRHNIAP